MRTYGQETRRRLVAFLPLLVANESKMLATCPRFPVQGPDFHNSVILMRTPNDNGSIKFIAKRVICEEGHGLRTREMKKSWSVPRLYSDTCLKGYDK